MLNLVALSTFPFSNVLTSSGVSKLFANNFVVDILLSKIDLQYFDYKHYSKSNPNLFQIIGKVK